jgi:hypothetical protein
MKAEGICGLGDGDCSESSLGAAKYNGDGSFSSFVLGNSFGNAMKVEGRESGEPAERGLPQPAARSATQDLWHFVRSSGNPGGCGLGQAALRSDGN